MSRFRQAHNRGTPGGNGGGDVRWGTDYKWRSTIIIPKERVRGGGILKVPIPFVFQANKLAYLSISTGNLLFNPYSSHAIRHTPIGNGAVVGIPPSVANGNPSVYDAGSIGAVGNLANLAKIEIPGFQGNMKYAHFVKAGETNVRSVGWNGQGPGTTFNGGYTKTYDITLPVPGGTGEDGYPVEYPTRNTNDNFNYTDSEVTFWPKDGNISVDMCQYFAQFCYNRFTGGGTRPATPGTADMEARYYTEQPLGGLDYPGPGALVDGNLGASQLATEFCTLKGDDINAADCGPIYHPLQCAVSRKPPVTSLGQILNKRRTWPSNGTDGITTGQNLGNIPYGTLAFITEADFQANKNSIALNNRQMRLLTAFTDYGMYIVDGSGETGGTNDTGKAQVRTDNNIDDAARADLNSMLVRLAARRLLKPLFNNRPYNIRPENNPEIWPVNGLPYRGGGGPKDLSRQRNTAYDIGGSLQGLVETPEGYDILLTDINDQPITMRRVTYDKTAGIFVGEILADLLDTSQDNYLRLYIGRPEQSTYNQNLSAFVAPYEFYYDLNNLNDPNNRTGKALTQIGTVADADNGVLKGSASDFTSTGVLQKTTADFSALNSKTGITMALRFKLDNRNVNRGMFNVGPFGSQSSGYLSFMARATGEQAANVFRAVVKLTAGGTASVESIGEVQTTEWCLVHAHINIASNNSKMWINGERVEGSVFSGATGLIQIPVGDLNIGTSSANAQAGGFDGLIDFLRISTTAPSDDFTRCEYQFFRDPETYYAYGDFDSPTDTTVSPIAIPMEANVISGVATTFDIFGRSVVPTGTVLSIVGAPAKGAATLVSSNHSIRYVASLGAVGSDSIKFRLTNGTKVSEALLKVTIISGATVPLEPPVALRTVNVPGNYSNILSALNNALPGDEIVLGAGTYTDNLDISIAGTQAAPIVIRSLDFQQAIITGNWRFSGNGIWLYGLTFNRPGTDPGTNGVQFQQRTEAGQNMFSVVFKAQYQTATRNKFRSPNSIMLYQNSGNTTTTKDININYNTFVGDAAPIWHGSACICVADTDAGAKGPHPVTIARNLFSLLSATTNGTKGDRYAIFSGRTEPGNNQSGVVVDWLVQYNFFDTVAGHAIFVKRGIGICEYNYFRSGTLVTLGGIAQNAGGWSGTDGATAFANLSSNRSLYRGNTLNKMCILISDTDSEWYGNKLINGGKIIVHCGSASDQGGGVFFNVTNAGNRTKLSDNDVATIELGNFNQQGNPAATLYTPTGGRLKDVAIYRGGFSPTIVVNAGGITDNPTGLPGGYSIADGFGGYEDITPIDPVDLLPNVGSDA